MTESTTAAELGPPESAEARRNRAKSPEFAAFQTALLLGALALAIVTRHTADWHQPGQIVILVVLSAVSYLTATSLSGSLNISGSLLSITLAAVLLGGPPAAIVGVLTIAIGWLRFRGAGHLLRHNLVMYAWFPLLCGLAFRVAFQAANLGAHHPYWHRPTYYLLVLATFVLALILNFAMVELSSAVLTLIAVFLVRELDKVQLGDVGLLMFAIVLVIFQYLMAELLLSQHRAKVLQAVATTDDLTGLANRKDFNDQVDQAIADADGTPATFGVLLLDLDHFKDINDTLGHQYGDDLLADLGPRLAERIGEGGLVARFGGDEFAILPAVRTENLAALTAIVEDVMACVREPVKFDDITLQVDASIGVARFPHDGQDAQTLLRRADIAMYSAKAERDGHRFYAHGQDRHSVSRLSMVGDFRRALEKDDEIVVHFHPIVDLGSGQVHGAEALVRWQHPDLGLLQPAAFLEIVEQTGLIGAMTTLVLQKAIAECAAWHAAGRDLTMSVNLSVRNLHDPMLSSQVAQMLDRHRLPPSALKLEITESMILSDPQRALATVESLSDIGVRFAVDDFGTGHSSLANLRRLPVHELKIDRSFVTPMLNEESDGVIVRSTIDLGHALGLKVVAEGVEDEVTLARLEEIGCDRAQGHFFSKPIPPIEFMRWISRYENRFPAAA